MKSKAKGYRAFFGLDNPAFGRGLPHDKLLIYPHLEEFADEVESLIADGGVGMLTGEMGIGKTTALRYILGQLDTRALQLCYHGSSRHSLAVLQQLVEQLGVAPGRQCSILLRQIGQRIGRAFREQGTKTVIILDDAQLLADDLLEDMRLLTNFEMDSQDALVLLLVGHPSLRIRLQKPVHLALADRSRMQYRLEGLSKDETVEYVDRHMRFAGAKTEVFKPDAKEALFEHAQGIPRRLNDLALTALKKSAKRNVKTIDADFISTVVAAMRKD
jgi:general secretion pathway protein A